MNALKHGLRAQTPVLPGEDERAYHARLDAWTAALKPRDEVEDFMVARAVHASWKIERVDRALKARREATRHADADRLAALAEQVAAMGRRLLWDPNGPLGLYPHAAPANGDTCRVSWSGDPDDPDDPARLVARLESMTLGCAWLLERWEELREVLEDGLLWQSHDRLKAIRLLGRQPLEAVDDKRVMAIYLSCWAMEPGQPHGFDDLLPELTAKERPVYFERLNAREPLGAMPEGPEAARADLLALIAQEEERLEGVLAVHLEREEAEAAAAQAFDATAYGERLRGYEALNDRLLVRLVEALRKRHQEPEGTTCPNGRARRDAKAVSTASDSHPRLAGPEWPGSEAASDVGASGGGEAASQAGAPGGGAGLAVGWTPATQDPSPPIGSDSRSACVPADFPLTQTAGHGEWEADVSIGEEMPFPAARILEVLGCGPENPPDDAKSRAPSELSEPEPARTEPRAPGDPSRAAAGIDSDAIERTEADGRGPRPSPNGTDQPVPSARRLAGAVLALFALVGAAGLPAASGRSQVEPTAASPGGPTGGILAVESSHGTTWAGWLCSSRVPDDPVVISRAWRGSGPAPGEGGPHWTSSWRS